MRWYLTVLRRYAVFRGRARRREFWMFTLVDLIVAVVLSGVDLLAGTDPWIAGIYGALVLLPMLAVTARRLHDTDRSAAWLLLHLIPLLGSLVLLVLNAQAGTPGENKYGPDPKGAALTGAVPAP